MDRMRSTANLLALVAGVFTAFAEVTFFRKHFGTRYFQSIKTALVLPLLFFFPIFWSHEDPRGLWWMLSIYTAMCLRHRISIWRRVAKGQTSGIHSQYNGISRLERLFPRVSEAKLKGTYEPMVMFGMGLAAHAVSPPLGWFFTWCSVAMGVHAGLIFAHQRQKETDLADARIEGQLMSGVVDEAVVTAPGGGMGAVVQVHGPVTHHHPRR